MEYLQKKYNIFINDLIQNENIWAKWKENNCPEMNKKKDINIENEKGSKDINNININTKITEAKNLFRNYNTNYYMNTDSNFIKNINSFKETKLEDIKFSESIEGLNSEVPFFGIYLEQIYKDLDPEEEEENTKERILNNMPSFSWKFLRLLSQGDINKINTEETYKLLNISEDYYKNFAPKEAQIKFNFKVLTPPPKIELKPKEKIPLPQVFLEVNNNKDVNLKEIKEETSEEETNQNKPKISLPQELVQREKEKEVNINEIKITPKKEEVKELLRIPSNLKIEEKKKTEEEKVFNISNNNAKISNEEKSQIKEKELIKEKNIEGNININKDVNDKGIIEMPKEYENNNPIVKKKEDIKKTNNDIVIKKIEEEKKKEINEKSQIKKEMDEKINPINNINNKQPIIVKKTNSNIINNKLNSNYNKEKELIMKNKDSKDLNKSLKIQDSTIPAGIINISKDSKNASLNNSEIKNIKSESFSFQKDLNINMNNKEPTMKAPLNSKISNNMANKNITENNFNNTNNKINVNIKHENSNYNSSNSKVFTDRKSPDNKQVLHNINSRNKINNNENNLIKQNNNRQDISTNRFENKYSTKYDNKYDNTKDNGKYENKYNNKYDNKYSDKYINKYENKNSKYDYKNDNKYENKYSDRYDNKYNNYKYDNNNTNYKYDNNNNHYDNRYRYDNNIYDRNQEKDNHFMNKKRFSDDKFDNYMSSNKKRK